MNLAVFGMRVGRLSEQIDSAERKYKEKFMLGQILAREQRYLDNAIRLKNRLGSLLQLITKITSDYKDARTGALEENLENTLDLAFPDEHFKIKIKYSQRGKQEQAELLIGKMLPNGSIKWGSPHCRSGDFAKQLISLCVVSEITMMLGSEMLFADEPLSNGDKVSLAEIGDFFRRLSEQGLQTLFIEHEEEMYSALPRREIVLEKDRAIGNVKIVGNQREGGLYEYESANGESVDDGSADGDIRGSTGNPSSQQAKTGNSGSRGVFETDGELLLGE